MNKLILLKRKNPVEYEVHKDEISQTKNLLLTTKDFDFAKRLVDGYNNQVPCNTEKDLEDTVTRILYQNSHDDSECMRIKFENVDKVIKMICKRVKLNYVSKSKIRKAKKK
ncbi:MAG: hypothetical protein AABY15_02940 [Nanoarchaeota archaeon]